LREHAASETLKTIAAQSRAIEDLWKAIERITGDAAQTKNDYVVPLATPLAPVDASRMDRLEAILNEMLIARWDSSSAAEAVVLRDGTRCDEVPSTECDGLPSHCLVAPGPPLTGLDPDACVFVPAALGAAGDGPWDVACWLRFLDDRVSLFDDACTQFFHVAAALDTIAAEVKDCQNQIQDLRGRLPDAPTVETVAPHIDNAAPTPPHLALLGGEYSQIMETLDRQEQWKCALAKSVTDLASKHAEMMQSNVGLFGRNMELQNVISDMNMAMKLAGAVPACVPAAPASAAAALCVGMRVMTHGLLKNPDLNSKFGTIVSVDPCSQRAGVRIDNYANPISVKCENLTLPFGLSATLLGPDYQNQNPTLKEETAVLHGSNGSASHHANLTCSPAESAGFVAACPPDRPLC
jgi:hypothetical protein